MKRRTEIKWINRLKREATAYVKHGKPIKFFADRVARDTDGLTIFINACNDELKNTRNRKRNK